MIENSLEVALLIIGAVVIVAGVYVVVELARRFKLVIKNIENQTNKISHNHENLMREVKALRTSQRSIDYHVNKQSIDLYRQIYAAKDIENLIGEGYVRNLRGWALSPDALLAIIRYVQEYKPKTILELGSGYSTVALSEYIKRNKLSTKIITVDHNRHYFEQTKTLLHSDIVTLVEAPLVEQKQGYSWYDTKQIQKATKALGVSVDLVIVDGPPETTNRYARRPVLEQLSKLMAKDYAIILDDAAREDEKAAVESWLGFDKKLTHNYIYTEKGLSVLSTKDVNPSNLL